MMEFFCILYKKSKLRNSNFQFPDKVWNHSMKVIICILTQTAFLNPIWGQHAKMIADINKTTRSGVHSSSAAIMKNVLYFVGGDQAEAGQELWRTDGTAQGTYMVKDIIKGEYSSYPKNIYATESKLFFTAMNKNGDNVLHVSDGTEKSTKEYPGLIKPTASITMGDFYYYMRQGPFGSAEVWKLNGNEDQNEVIFLSQDNANPVPVFYQAGKLIYFIIQKNNNETELWRTDGTNEGTILIINQKNGFVFGGVQAAGEALFFWKYDLLRGYILCVTKGTPETTFEVDDFEPESIGNYSVVHTASPTHYIFKLEVAGEFRYYYTDGTKQGTLQFNFGGEHPTYMEYVDGKIYGYNIGILVSENFSPFIRLTDPGLEILGLNTRFFPYKGNIYCNIYTYKEGIEPWVSDGTKEGTMLISDIVPGVMGSNATPLMIWNDDLIWLCADQYYGSEFRKLSTSRKQLELLVDANIYTNDSYLGDYIFKGDDLYFTANDGIPESEFYTYNIKNENLSKIDFKPDKVGSYPGNFISYNNYLIFDAYDIDGSLKIWSRNDFTGDIEIILQSIPPYVHANIDGYAFCGDKLYFIGPVGPEETIYTTDGTKENTRMVFPGLGATVESILCLNNVLYFTVNNSKLYQFVPGSSSPKLIIEKVNILELTKSKDFLVFRTNDGISGHTMWAFKDKDGKVELTKLIEPGSFEPFPSDFYTLNNKVFFMVYNEKRARELWSTDGTIEGTIAVKAIIGPPGNMDAIGMAASDSLIYILLSSFSFNGYRSLWRSDGTEQGTFNITTYRNHESGKTATNVGTWKNLVYFPGFDEQNGTELWVSDGTLENTKLLQDICLGPCSSYPTTFFSKDSSIFFIANNNINGFELWNMKGGIPPDEVVDSSSMSLLTILQNPLQHRTLSFQISNLPEFELTFDLFSLSGTRIWTNSASYSPDSIEFQYQLPNIPQGIYIFCVSGKDVSFKTKIFVAP